MDNTAKKDAEDGGIMSQCDQILAYLKKGNGITQKEAIDKFKCYRLASRINDLKKRGIKIYKVMETNANGRHARYYLDVGW